MNELARLLGEAEADVCAALDLLAPPRRVNADSTARARLSSAQATLAEAWRVLRRQLAHERASSPPWDDVEGLR